MKKKSQNVATILAVVSASLMFCDLATAEIGTPDAVTRPIVGSIDFGGVVALNTTSLSTATQVSAWNNSFVLQGDGDFQSIPFGTQAMMVPQWIFNQGTPASPSPGPATPTLWQVGGFTFDLDFSNVMPGQNNNFLHVTGPGTVSSTESFLMPTPGVWSFTISNSNGQDQSTFGFQANATAVPEAGTFTLLAIGVVGLGCITLLRRKPVHHHYP